MLLISHPPNITLIPKPAPFEINTWNFARSHLIIQGMTVTLNYSLRDLDTTAAENNESINLVE